MAVDIYHIHYDVKFTFLRFVTTILMCLAENTRQEKGQHILKINPAGIYPLKFNNKNTRTKCEICSKLTIKTPERRHWRRSGVFIINLEHISHLVLMFLLLTLCG